MLINLILLCKKWLTLTFEQENLHQQDSIQNKLYSYIAYFKSINNFVVLQTKCLA